MMPSTPLWCALLGLFFVSVLSQSIYPSDCLIPNAVVPTGFCARKWATGLAGPRGIIALSNNDVIVVESTRGQISLFYENAAGLQKVLLASASGLNHGVVFHGEYLYASSSSTVFRWPFKEGTRSPLGASQTVITGIPTGGHSTRTLIFDHNGNLLVQLGSNANIDKGGRAGIYRFDVSSFPTTFASGVAIFTGLRNEVGLRYDSQGRLWGVENGVDNLARPDLGGDIHAQNPGEEINLLNQEGKFYGYPYCWSQYNLTTVTTPRNTQYAQPDFMNDTIHTDAWCQNGANVVPPAWTLRAHTAPLDIIFYNGTSFPNHLNDAFVTQHGSWDRQPPAGYAVVHLQISPETHLPVSDEKFFSFAGPGETGPAWPYRPVALAWATVGKEEALLVTDDTGGNIISITFTPSCTCTVAPSF